MVSFVAGASPDDEVIKYRTNAGMQKASYGVDSPLGFALSSVFSPLYAYATFKGKYDKWNSLLSSLPASALKGPTLDAGCGRGLVLIKTAKMLSESCAYGIDIFDHRDQSGNHPKATVENIVAENVVQKTVLHRGSFTTLPYADGQFTLVTCSLALHNPKSIEDRRNAVRELARVVIPGGHLVILDLVGRNQTILYEKTLKEIGWMDVHREFAGLGVSFGLWYCEVIRAITQRYLWNIFKYTKS